MFQRAKWGFLGVVALAVVAVGCKGQGGSLKGQKALPDGVESVRADFSLNFLDVGTGTTSPVSMKPYLRINSPNALPPADGSNNCTVEFTDEVENADLAVDPTNANIEIISKAPSPCINNVTTTVTMDSFSDGTNVYTFVLGDGLTTSMDKISVIFNGANPAASTLPAKYVSAAGVAYFLSISGTYTASPVAPATNYALTLTYSTDRNTVADATKGSTTNTTSTLTATSNASTVPNPATPAITHTLANSVESFYVSGSFGNSTNPTTAPFVTACRIVVLDAAMATTTVGSAGTTPFTFTSPRSVAATTDVEPYFLANPTNVAGDVASGIFLCTGGTAPYQFGNAVPKNTTAQKIMGWGRSDLTPSVTNPFYPNLYRHDVAIIFKNQESGKAASYKVVRFPCKTTPNFCRNL